MPDGPAALEEAYNAVEDIVNEVEQYVKVRVTLLAQQVLRLLVLVELLFLGIGFKEIICLIYVITMQTMMFHVHEFVRIQLFSLLSLTRCGCSTSVCGTCKLRTSTIVWVKISPSGRRC